jgi:hypothetical protein
LDNYINTVNNKVNNEINIIRLSNKGKKKIDVLKEKVYNTTKYFNPTQTYRITDIPGEYSNNRIKGTLKSFGKVIELEIIKNKNNTKEKTTQVTIKPLLQSKDISNR